MGRGIVLSFRPTSWSINRRLLIAGLLLIPILLGTLGLGFHMATQKAARIAQRQNMQLTVYHMMANAEIAPDGMLNMAPILEEPDLSQPQSGTYAVIADLAGREFWRSDSAVSSTLPNVFFSNGEIQFGEDYYRWENKFAHYFRPVIWELPDGQQVALVFHVFQRGNVLNERLHAFMSILRYGLLISALILLGLLLVIVRWGLRPIGLVIEQLDAVEEGKTEQITGEYPKELNGLISAINRLLQNEQAQRQRYRKALADLAHSLKTPLSVLRGDINQLANNDRERTELSIKQMQEIIDFQLQKAAIQHAMFSGQKVDLVVLCQRVISTMQKVYADRQITTAMHGLAEGFVLGDERDLLELLGNLLDNAFKACRAHVAVDFKMVGNELIMSVDDDGEGIDTNMLQEITQRGVRADQYQSGHGIGLAMVADIVASMKGHLALEKSHLGGARFVVSFSRL